METCPSSTGKGIKTRQSVCLQTWVCPMCRGESLEDHISVVGTGDLCGGNCNYEELSLSRFNLI